MGCTIAQWIVAVFFLLAWLAAAYGVFHIHMNGGQLNLVAFGNTNSSLSLLAFVVTLRFAVKQLHGCMGCGGCCSRK